MGFLEFAASTLASLAWPLTVLLLVWLLRQELLHTLPPLKRLGYRGFEAEFGKALRRAEDAAQAIEDHPARQSADEAHAVPLVELRSCTERLAAVSPRAAIVEAWSDVERALRRTGADTLRETHVGSTTLWIRGLVDAPLFSLIQELRRLRNRAAHARDFEVTVDQAFEYAELAEIVISSLPSGAK